MTQLIQYTVVVTAILAIMAGSNLVDYMRASARARGHWTGKEKGLSLLTVLVIITVSGMALWVVWVLGNFT